MAIYRSDQAQVTFAVEASPGGSPELASVATRNTTPVLTGQIPAACTLNQLGSGGSVNTGTHYYKITHVNTSSKIETEAGVASAAMATTAGNNEIQLANIYAQANTALGVDARYIYRTLTDAAVDSTYFFVAAIANNTAIVYIDTIADSALGDAAPTSGFITATAGVEAGARSIPVAEGWNVIAGHTGAHMPSVSHFQVGDFIQIGPTLGPTNAGGSARESEVRRVEFIEGTSLVIDRPTAFFHDDTTNIQRVTALTDTTLDKFITFVPGVYETVEVPDPQMAIEPKYYLGTASKRNPYQFLKGQQTYTGSIGGFVLLDGRALRFPIGKVNTTTTFVNTASGGANDPTYGAMINNTAGYKKGDVFINIDAALSGGVVLGTHLLFTGSTTATTTSTATSEVRKHVGITTVASLQLDSPLQFAHADNEFVYAITTTAGGTTVQVDSDTTLIPYAHTIAETVDLDSVSWHVHVRDSSETDANDFDRRYYGGKIGNISLSAEEGGLLTAGWDGVNFLGMAHNQKSHSGFTGDLPFYSLMQPIRDADVDAPGTIDTTATAEPYYFSQGQVTLFGSVVARVRSFSLSIANNEEPRYYLKRTMGNHRGPSEILEQRREYTCSVTLALPDATTNTATAINVFKELLLEGDYGSGMQGFNVELRFDRGANDNIVVTIPDDGVAATGGNQQGAFINTAPHNISEANPMEVEAEILFRNLKIEVNDNIAVYP
jgi:hypothetical protein